MQRSKSYYFSIHYLTILLSFCIIHISHHSAFASNEATSNNQTEKNQILIDEKKPVASAVEQGQNGLSSKDIPATGNQTDAQKTDTITQEVVPGTNALATNPQGIEGGEADALKDQNEIQDGKTLAQAKEVPTSPEITIELNKPVVDHITYFQTRIKDKFTLWLSRSNRYIPMMKQILKEATLPEDLVYLSLIESGFNPNAYSRARAVGPWQFIRSTGKKYGLRIDDWVDERRDPAKSTAAAARYLKDLFNMFGSWNLALASYNAGEGRIQRAILKSKRDDFWDLRSTKHIKRETKDYVPKFMAATIIAKNPERYGFDVEYSSPMLFDEVTVDTTTSLSIIAKASEASLEEIRELNPDLKRNMTPPGVKDYVVHIPYGKKELFYNNYNAIPKGERLSTQKYQIKRGETLSTISKRFGIPIDTLREINGLSKNKVLKEGEYIVIVAIPWRPEKKIEYAKAERNSIKKGNDDVNDVTYKVRRGDTLWDISKKFNIPVEQIKRWNGIGHRNIIKPGDKLTLNPDGTTG